MFAALLVIAVQAPQITIVDKRDDYLRPAFEEYVKDGVKRAEVFFQKPYPKPFRVDLLPSRAAFDKALKDRWNEESPGPWAVGAAGADCLYVLTPRVWKTEAAEHDPDDADHIRRIIAHELVHVYHGQINPSKDWEGMDDMAWLIEGVATYASGQLDEEHRGRDFAAIKAGKEPKSLAAAWSGRDRYPISGSLVRYIDKKYGRNTLVDVLRLTKQQDVMKALKTSEKDFLSDWKLSVERSGE